MEQVVVKEEPITPAQERTVDEKHLVQEGPVVAKDVTESAYQANGTPNELKQSAPETPQQMKDVEMDLNPEVNEYVHPEMADDKAAVDAGLDADETDVEKLNDANGADVSDARLQAKVDEAHAKENARQTAVEVQQDTHSEKNESGKHREVSSRLEDVAEAAGLAGTESDFEK